MIEERMNELKKKLVEYSSLAMDMVDKSVRGLVDSDEERIREVLENDEPRVNNLEIEIDDMCVTIVMKFQPKAIDLRTIIMLLKMNNDLERIGDHAVNISQSALVLLNKPLVKPLIDIPRMAEMVVGMLNNGVKSFVDDDPSLARTVCERDSEVDGLRDQILRELITHMIKDPATIERSLHLWRITQNLERIADLSTNICEEVIYLVQGRVIKHHHENSEPQYVKRKIQ
ncbi:phosphate signaling complex protein PhoU [candidate division WOR-3 bacterium]|nr:phosphate signaling complex protein PhoU [candidate division WOR-3 bacterium]